MNRFSYMTRRFGEGHRVYQNSAPLFDSSIWQLLWPLTCGGVAVLPQDRGHWRLEAVVEAIERFGITMTDFVPTLFKALVRSMEHGQILPHRLRSLEYVLIGGEAIDPVSVHAFRRMLPAVRIINTYGHTEASIGMVFHEVSDADGDQIPLGAPIDNTFARIIDESMREVPKGSFGEILVAGVCVGAGYLKAPELTAKAFVPNPFPDLPGETVYRSGDLGRVREDGLLEFAGRLDDQVKVRGVRIELTELNVAMRQAFSSIADVCGVVITTPLGEQSLAVAYAAGKPIALPVLRQKLLGVLPASHMPQFFLHLEKMPTGVTGKTDRKEIVRRVSSMLAQSAAADQHPQTTLGTIKAGYQAILGAQDIGDDTHFFDYGGDSLGAIHLSLALQDSLGYFVPANLIYRYPTPLSLSAALSGTLIGQTQALKLPTISFDNPRRPKAVSRHVLLTGATGFVGSYVLERLLVDTNLRISVLVRGKGGQCASERLRVSMRRAVPARVVPMERITTLEGDLARPSLGLSEQAWRALAMEVDEIVHCGADVNFLGAPTSLFDVNVQGTAELIRLCNEGAGKRLHHISSLAVRHVDPQATHADAARGYEYTKYLAEQLVADARRQGLMARVYRLDDVLPALGSGQPNERSLIHLFLKLCLRYGMAVRHSGSVGLLPVDVFAEWICSFVGEEDAFSSLPDRVNVIATCRVAIEEMTHFVAQGIGRSLRAVDYGEFLARLATDSDKDALLLRGMLPSADEQGFAIGATRVYGTEDSALLLPPWQSRFRLNLNDFHPFVRYMDTHMRTVADRQVPL
jgi:thioester reductase-like protein